MLVLILVLAEYWGGGAILLYLNEKPKEPVIHVVALKGKQLP